MNLKQRFQAVRWKRQMHVGVQKITGSYRIRQRMTGCRGQHYTSQQTCTTARNLLEEEEEQEVSQRSFSCRFGPLTNAVTCWSCSGSFPSKFSAQSAVSPHLQWPSWINIHKSAQKSQKNDAPHNFWIIQRESSYIHECNANRSC